MKGVLRFAGIALALWWAAPSQAAASPPDDPGLAAPAPVVLPTNRLAPAGQIGSGAPAFVESADGRELLRAPEAAVPVPVPMAPTPAGIAAAPGLPSPLPMPSDTEGEAIGRAPVPPRATVRPIEPPVGSTPSTDKIEDEQTIEGLPAQAIARPPAAPPLLTRHREDSAGTFQSSKSHVIFFWIGAAMALIGAMMAIASRTPMRCVVGLLLTVLATAGFYLLLHAELLAAVQVIVYAGAVVVLFAFVIMFLQQGALPAPGERWLPIRFIAAVALAYFFYLAAPEISSVGMGARIPQVPHFGETAGLGEALFKTYLVPFEALSALLLASIVGAVAIARGDRKPKADARKPGGDE